VIDWLLKFSSYAYVNIVDADVHYRQLNESKQKISSLTEQLERKATVNSAAGDAHGAENGPDDASVLKVCSVCWNLALTKQ